MGGIALHLMTYHIDQSVSFGNRCLWFRVRKGQSQKSENHRALFIGIGKHVNVKTLVETSMVGGLRI